MLKCHIKVLKNCSTSIFDDILANNPGTIKPEKTKKNSKKRLLGPMSQSKLFENGPEIV